jgi:hypothetical protein
MNAGTCWGKNTIDPRGRSVEKAPGSDFTFTLGLLYCFLLDTFLTYARNFPIFVVVLFLNVVYLRLFVLGLVIDPFFTAQLMDHTECW